MGQDLWGKGGRHSRIFDGIFVHPSLIYINILISTSGFQKKLHSPSLEMLLFFIPPPSECAGFWSPLPDVFHPFP